MQATIGLTFRSFLTERPEEIRTKLTSAPINFYGIAIAGFQDSQDSNKYKLIWNTVCVSNHELAKFNLAPEMSSSRDVLQTKDWINALSSLVDTVEVLIKKQSKICKESSIAYRPVSLLIGQDGRKETLLNDVFVAIFGRVIPAVIEDRSTLTTFTDSITNNNFHQELFLEGLDPSLRKKYISTLKKIRELLPYCTLTPGNYTGDTVYAKDMEQTKLDKQFLDLRARGIDLGCVSEEVHKETIELAYKYGASKGELLESRIFAISPLTNLDNEERNRLASHSFQEWHPDYRRALYRGLFSTITYTRVRYLKLPTDPCNPAFTDPVADMIREQHEVTNGVRSTVEDRPHIRQTLIDTIDKILDPNDKRTETPRCLERGSPLHSRLAEVLTDASPNERLKLLSKELRLDKNLPQQLLISECFALVSFLDSELFKSYDNDPNFTPHRKQIALIVKMAKLLGKNNANEDSYEGNINYLKAIAETWRPLYAKYKHRTSFTKNETAELFGVLNRQGLYTLVS